MKTELFNEINKLDSIVTAEEIAKLLKVARATVIRWVHEGRLAALNPGERVMRFQREDVRAFVLASYTGAK